ncbi:uncharacterized protein LOC111362201 [Spodoptera litura]|uniref:Uncharacterized protein LOC111362201 n=1 Tax=Spodoptera litura TaxID=69820 RepID=A0A9J7ENA4_SPOLT|nr:uncharacterized protein LOC111362201 [Spodoptera litura]
MVSKKKKNNLKQQKSYKRKFLQESSSESEDEEHLCNDDSDDEMNVDDEDHNKFLQTAIEKLTVETIKNGFRAGGLYPFGPEFVDMSKIKSQNRQNVDSTRQREFLRTLENKTETTLSCAILKLFKDLYYKSRLELENLLPNEDESLYLIWAKTDEITKNKKRKLKEKIPFSITSPAWKAYNTKKEEEKRKEIEEKALRAKKREENKMKKLNEKKKVSNKRKIRVESSETEDEVIYAESDDSVLTEGSESNDAPLEKLKTEGTYACGTIRANRKGIPNNLVADSKLKRGEYDYRFSNFNIAYYKWKDNKIVNLASNFHGNDEDMPRKYIRKVGVRPRAEWTQEALIAAMDEISKGILGINEISRRYGIPSRTLRRRFANKNTEKLTLVPESFFAISDISLSNQRPTEDNAGENDAPEPEQVSSSRSSPVVDRVLSNVTPNYMDIFNRTEEALEQEPDPSNVQTLGSDLNLSNVSPCNTDRPEKRFSNSSPSILSQNNNIINIEELETPSKYLQESSPVPIVPVPFHKRGKQSAAILNTKENIEAKKSKVKGKATPGIRCKNKCQTAKADVQKKVLRTAVKFPKKIPAKCIKKRKGIRESSDETTISDISNESDSDFDQARVSEIDLHKKKQRSQAKNQSKVPTKTYKKRRIEHKESSDEISISNNSDESESEAHKDSECKECFEEYKKTKSTADWIQCVMCKKWLHEDCTMYGDYCNKCGRIKRMNTKKTP